MRDSLAAQLDLIIIPALAEVIVGEMKDNVRVLRFEALKQLRGVLECYGERGYMEELICKIAEKKVALISHVNSKADMKRVLTPHAPTYDGNKFIPDPFSVPEEELICWSETSLKAPLSSAGFERYKEVFRIVFPEKWNEIYNNKMKKEILEV